MPFSVKLKAFIPLSSTLLTGGRHSGRDLGLKSKGLSRKPHSEVGVGGCGSAKQPATCRGKARLLFLRRFTKNSGEAASRCGDRPGAFFFFFKRTAADVSCVLCSNGRKWLSTVLT